MDTREEETRWVGGSNVGDDRHSLMEICKKIRNIRGTSRFTLSTLSRNAFRTNNSHFAGKIFFFFSTTRLKVRPC